MNLGLDQNKNKFELNLDRLIETRLLLQANSGGGKSWALRRILEQTHGKVQQIVIDVEDEFHTLREKYDYILAGSSGADCKADVKSAALLARKLLELRVSSIVGIFELKAHDRIKFVRLFLDALVNAPRELWHPVLIVVDEAHIFCPQHGEAESAGAVIDLMTRGRKRGFCGILATQRISKLHKDAAAEANNKLIGRSALDVDMKRSADELGFFGREQQMSLRTLKPGQFFSFGPALSDVVTEITVGGTETTHPKAGSNSAPPPPPREKIKKFLSQMADLPKQADEEQRNVESLSRKVQELEFQLKRKSPAVDPVANEQKIVDTITACRRQFHNDMRVIWEELKRRLTMEFNSLLDKNGKELDDALTINKPVNLNVAPSKNSFQNFACTMARAMAGHGVGGINIDGRKLRESKGKIVHVPEEGASPSLSKAERMILSIVSHYPNGRTKVQIALMTRYAHNGGSFNNAISSLRSKGLIEGDSAKILITDLGLSTIGPTALLPSGNELLNYWMNDCSKAEREILEVLRNVYPSTFTKQEIADLTESKYEANGGSFNNAISRLRTLELINGKKDISLSKELTDAAPME